jgi:ABC-2 type transport system permease protein
MSGFLMPVAFFPPWAQTLMRLTPFPSFVNTPTEICVNVATGERMLFLLAVQAFWAIALIALGQIALAFGLRRLTMQGG